LFADGKITEDGPELQALDPDLMSIMSERERAEQ
jgi:hypothetical protein